MFGAVNALFAGFAFAGVIGAIILQRNELRLQRQELSDTREEMRGQKDQLKAQAQTLKKRNFEDSFFQLLRFHVDIVSSLETDISGVRVGRNALNSLKSQLTLQFKNSKPNEEFEVIWQQFADEYQSDFDHYFRHLYNALKFVDEHDFLQNLQDKRQYANFIRGQLSSSEQLLLFCYGISEKGAELKVLVENYSLLEGLNTNDPPIPKYKCRYADVAFGCDSS